MVLDRKVHPKMNALRAIQVKRVCKIPQMVLHDVEKHRTK